MDEDKLNMDIRRFLKKVGITSQREIEKAIFNGLENNKISQDQELDISITLNIDSLNLEHKIKDTINLK
tara:strand:- start:111 stop:317 length:207 start_codon:yes stop_codon:yes gene_type:complete